MTRYPIQTPHGKIRGTYTHTASGIQLTFNSAADEAATWRFVARDAWEQPRLVTTQARPQARPQPLTMAHIEQVRTAGVPLPPDVGKEVLRIQASRQPSSVHSQKPPVRQALATPTPRAVSALVCKTCRQVQCRCGVPELHTAERVLQRQRELEKR